MGTSNIGTTDPKLLERVCDWRDHAAWIAFHRRYDPLLRRWSQRFALDHEQSEELCQRIWIELADKMKTFRFDPGKKFRGWLWTLFRCRASDHLRRLNASLARSVEEISLTARVIGGRTEADESAADDAGGADRVALLVLAERVQEKVRATGRSGYLRVFWLIEIDGLKVKEAAERTGKKYAAAYLAHHRVAQKLRAEGQRILAEGVGASSVADEMTESGDHSQRHDD